MSFWTEFRDVVKIVGAVVAAFYGYYGFALALTADVYNRDQRRRATRRARADFLASLKDRYQMVRGGTEPRKMLYGRARISGPIVFGHSSGTKKEFLHLVVALVGHECTTMDAVLFNDVALPAEDGSGFIQSGEYALNTTISAVEVFSGTSKTLAQTPASIVAVTRDGGSGDGIFSTVLTNPTDYTIAGATLTIPGGGVGTINYTYTQITPRVRIKKFMGTATQAASADLISETGGKWTSAHQLKGICYLYVRLEYDQQVFGQSGLPNISAVVFGKRVYDPRQDSTAGGSGPQRIATPSTWVFSDNAALCTADYLRDTAFGMQATAAQTPAAESIVAAAICDQLVSIYATGTASYTNGSPNVTGSGTSWLNRVRPGMFFMRNSDGVDYMVLSVTSNTALVLDFNYAGTTGSGAAYTVREKRYTANGVLDSADPARNNLDKLVECMAGTVVWTQGRWLIRAGAHLSASLTITEDWLGDKAPQISPRAPRQELFNRVLATYAEREKLYTEVQAPPVTNATYVSDDGGLDLPTEVTYDLCTGGLRAQRLAKIHLERTRQALTVRLSCNLRAYDLSPSDVVALTLARYGWSAKLFEVVQRTLDLESRQVELLLRETASGVWDWALGAETAIDLTPNTELPSPFTAPATLTGMSVTSGTAQLLKLGDGSIITRALVAWTASADIYTQAGGRIEVRWKLDNATEWVSAPSVPGDSVNTLIGPLDDLRVNIVQIRPVNSRGRFGAWTSTTHLVIGKVAQPANVAGLAAITLAQGARLNWNDNTEVDYESTELRYGASWAAGTRIFRGNASAYNWVNPAVGVYTVWAKHFDTTGNESATAASVSATVLYQGDVNATVGRILNGNPQCSVIGAGGWQTFSGGLATVQTGISGGVTGTTCLRSNQADGINHCFDATKLIPLNREKTYRVSALVRRSASGTVGTLFLGILQIDSGGTTQAAWGTYTQYSIAGSSVATTFERHSVVISGASASFNAGCMYISPDVILGYLPGAITGYLECQDAKLEELADTEWIAAEAATQTISDYSAGVGSVSTGLITQRSMTLTPTADCIIEFQVAITVAGCLPDSGNQCGWWLQQGGGSDNSLVGVYSVNTDKKTMTTSYSVAATGGQAQVFRFKTNRAGGNPAMTVDEVFMRATAIKR